jgi:hypothetical protein
MAIMGSNLNYNQAETSLSQLKQSPRANFIG